MSIDGFDFTVIANGRIDPDSPLSTDLFTHIRDNMEFLKLWLGKNYVGAAVADHNHDGANSKQIDAGDLLNSVGDFVWVDTATAAFTDGSGGAAGVVDVSSFVPVGTESVQLQVDLIWTTGAVSIGFREPGTGTYRTVLDGTPSVALRTAFPIIPVNSSREIDRSSAVDSGNSVSAIVRSYQL